MGIMKVIAAMGISKTGKTTVVENIARELRRRGYSVGSVKEIHYEKFHIDTEGTNTDRHRKAGSQLVTALGLYETDVLFQRRLSINEILKFYDHDYVILEGTRGFPCPKILTAATTQEIDDLLNDSVFAISGKIANELKEYKGIPVINCIEEPERLTDAVMQTAFEVLPDFKPECCGVCGADCKTLCEDIVQGRRKREDCTFNSGNISLKIDGKDINMVPFVQKLLYNALIGVVSELDGYREGAGISVEIGIKGENTK